MLIKMLNQAQYDLLNYPRRSVGFHIARPFKALSGRNNDPVDRLAYSNSVLAKAMMDYYKKHVNSEEAKEIMDVVKRYFQRWSFGGKKIFHVDDVYAGMALIDVHEITGDDRYKEYADIILNWVMAAETDQEGSLFYRPAKKDNYIMAETIGYVCPFLAKYGATYNDMNATNMAITLIQNYVAHGFDEKLILPYHGYNTENGMKMGIIGWGQAVGQVMIGMAETLQYLETDRPSYESLRMTFRRIVDKVEAYQLEGGLYAWQLPAKDGPVDTAATAMILYALGISLEDKVLIGIHKSRLLRGVEALKECIQEDGSLPGAALPAKVPGSYPMEFGAYPWALGPALSLFVLLEE
ncbi:MAG: glycoside hydrolase family 88 protein [Lachnospiraceae bacterium]|nr:glycoside hydrolase family 88 protein [Lachnospiraceae bacterium]